MERVVVQELKLVRGLSGNEAKKRQRVVRALRKWLEAREASSFDFTEHDFDRLWKGLFYCAWMSDKPLVQEELCDTIAKLFECFKKFSSSILFYKSFLKTMAKDWFGIDQHRIDKFLMLVRRVTRGLLYSMRKHEWSKNVTTALHSCLSEGIFSVPPLPEYRMALGLQLHFIDCWLEEVAKVSEGKISSKIVTRLVKPFAYYLCNGQENRICSNIVKNVFVHLMKQTDLGIEYSEKELAWRNAGYPGGSIDAMEKITESDSDDDHGNDDYRETDKTPRKQGLDPRAGRVDTVLPQLEVDGKEIALMLQDLIPESQVSCSNRNRIRELITNFDKLSSGKYPLTMKNIVLPNDSKFKIPKAFKAAAELLNFEKEIDEKNEERELIGLNKRQKRKFLTKLRKKSFDQNENDDDTSNIDEHIPKKKKKKNDDISGNWTIENIKDVKNNNSINDYTNNSKNINNFNGCNENSKSVTLGLQKSNDLNITESITKVSLKENANKKGLSLDTPTPNISFGVVPLKKNGIDNKYDTLNKITTSTPLTSKNSVKKEKSFDEANKSSSTNKKIKSPKENKKTLNKMMNLNTKDKNDEETEITISLKKKLKSKNHNKSDSDILKAKTKKNKFISDKLSATMTPSKKVNIALTKNTSHAVIDYFKSVKQSPEIPFDGGKKPMKTSLKPNSMPSPVNPFYKNKLNIYLSY